MSDYLTHFTLSSVRAQKFFSVSLFSSCRCNSAGEGDQNISASSSSYSIQIVDQSGEGECKGTMCALHDDYIYVGTISHQHLVLRCL
jgi:hypothetical protein